MSNMAIDNLTQLKQQLPTTFSIYSHICSSPADRVKTVLASDLQTGVHAESWLIPFRIARPAACMRLNHRQGYGCSFSGCTFEHACLLCGREGHGVHQLRQNGTYRCQVMRKYMVEQCTNPLDDRQLRELFNQSTAAAAQPSVVQSSTPACKLLLAQSCLPAHRQSSARAPSTAFKIHSWSGQPVSNAAADNQPSVDLMERSHISGGFDGHTTDSISTTCEAHLLRILIKVRGTDKERLLCIPMKALQGIYRRPGGQLASGARVSCAAESFCGECSVRFFEGRGGATTLRLDETALRVAAFRIEIENFPDFPALPRAIAAEDARNSLTITVDSDYSEASSSCSSSPNHSLCDLPKVPDSTGAKSEDEDLCVVCLEGPREVFFFPCGHRHTCPECAELVEDCPTCRAEIKGRCRAFL